MIGAALASIYVNPRKWFGSSVFVTLFFVICIVSIPSNKLSLVIEITPIFVKMSLLCIYIFNLFAWPFTLRVLTISLPSGSKPNVLASIKSSPIKSLSNAGDKFIAEADDFIPAKLPINVFLLICVCVFSLKQMMYSIGDAEAKSEKVLSYTYISSAYDTIIARLHVKSQPENVDLVTPGFKRIPGPIDEFTASPIFFIEKSVLNTSRKYAVKPFTEINFIVLSVANISILAVIVKVSPKLTVILFINWIRSPSTAFEIASVNDCKSVT